MRIVRDRSMEILIFKLSNNYVFLCFNIKLSDLCRAWRKIIGDVVYRIKYRNVCSTLSKLTKILRLNNSNEILSKLFRDWFNSREGNTMADVEDGEISKQREKERERIIQLFINAGRRPWKVVWRARLQTPFNRLARSFSNVSVSDNAEIFRLIQTDAARLI